MSRAITCCGRLTGSSICRAFGLKRRTFAAERRIVCLQDEPAAVGPQGAIVAIEQRIRLAPCVERADTAAEHVLPVIGRIHANIVEVVMR